jgi:holo-[acyl-carrier protein] synthase
MVMGIGIDIVKVGKMQGAIEKLGKDFLKRVFDGRELKNISNGKMYYQRLAARFAAKEAIIKAISKEYPLALNEIIILNRKNGAPYCEFKKKLNIEILLSISHIEDYAVACAVAQKK